MRTPVPTAAALVVAGLLLTACSSGDSDAEKSLSNENGQPSESDSSSGAGDGHGTLTIDGVTVTFTPSLCFIDGNDVLFSGPGTTDTGDLAHVDAGDRTQLTVYMGVDDPFDEPDFLYENLGAGQDLEGLQIDGATLTAQPQMHRVDADRTVFDEVGVAELEVSCG